MSKTHRNSPCNPYNVFAAETCLLQYEAAQTICNHSILDHSSKDIVIKPGCREWPTEWKMGTCVLARPAATHRSWAAAAPWLAAVPIVHTSWLPRREKKETDASPEEGESVAGLFLNKISLNATLWFSTKAIGEAQKQTSSSTRKFSLNARTHIFNRRRFSSKPVRYQKTQLQSAVGADRTPAVRLSYSGLRSRIQEKSRVHSKSGKTLFAKQKRHLSPTNSFCGPDKTSDLQLSFRPRLWVFRPAPILQADSSFLRRWDSPASSPASYRPSANQRPCLRWSPVGRTCPRISA